MKPQNAMSALIAAILLAAAPRLALAKGGADDPKPHGLKLARGGHDDPKPHGLKLARGGHDDPKPHGLKLA